MKSYYQTKMDEYKRKFGIDSLAVDGLAPKERKNELETMQIDHDKAVFQNMKIAVGHCSYQGKKLTLYYDRSK